MKKKAIVVALLTALLLTGCNKTIPTMNTVEETPQVTEETTTVEENPKDEVIAQNWWKDKAFKSTDSGLYFWIEEDDTTLWFMVGTEYLNDQNCQVVGNADKENISVDIDRNDEFVRYRFKDNTLNTVTSVQWFYNKDEVLLLSKSTLNDQWSDYSDTYLSVEEETQPDETPVEEPTEEIPEEFIPESRNYECFETSGGWDAEIAIYFNKDSIDLDVIGITGGTLELEEPTIYSGYWEDFDSQVTVQIPDNSSEIVFTATGELEQYNGTYIQLPDLGTDGEN